MQKNIGTINKILGLLAFLYSYGAIEAVVNWSGSSTPDVTNDNLTISADSQLTSASGYVNITASTTNITVALTKVAEPTVVSAGTATTLFLEATSPYTITFQMNHSLQLSGQTAIDGGAPLFIAVRGGGSVIFNIDGGKSLTLTPNGVGGGSVQFYVIMDGSILRFNRMAVNPGGNIFVTAGTNAVLGYATDNALSAQTGLGTILFDPTNTGTGVMALQVSDQSNLLISGRLIAGISQEDYGLTYTYITSEPAGCTALFEIQNSNTAASSRLLVLNSNDTLPLDEIWHPGTYLGQAYGYVLGTNGQLSVGTLSYLDYVGLSIDTCLTGSANVPCCLESTTNACSCGNICATCDFTILCLTGAEKVFKKRNPSALIVDGYDNIDAVPACINLADQSAIVFRSGVDCHGVVENGLSSTYPYAVSPSNRTTGPGNMVFDVEGCLTIAGTGTNPVIHPTKIEILSLNVTPTGATVLINGTGSKNFPARNFAIDSDGEFIAYNSGYFFINNNVILCKTFLVHTDQNHKVYDNNSICSEPAYVGGETFKLTDLTGTWTSGRPKLIFSNSTAMFHTSLAVTGLDLEIPNALACCLTCTEYSLRTVPLRCTECNQAAVYPCHRSRNFAKIHNAYRSENIIKRCLSNAAPCDNLSNFIFFYNGYARDNGTGRQLILGTYLGSFSCDCSMEISQDAHLDVMQLAGQSCTCANTHELVLTVSPNNSTIIQGVPNNIAGQYSVNTIYLGHASNISIGSPLDSIPTNSSCPVLTINGNYFSFGTYGGLSHDPQTSNLTGQGGIFVDSNGTIRAINTCGVNMGAMVTKSGNGIIDLPDPIVRFGCGVGESDWKYDVNVTPTIIAFDTVIADYVLSWNTICKSPNFLPFVCTCTVCPANAATIANVTGLPTVLGQVDQLLINGSRIGDPAHVKIGLGGYVRELVFLDSCNQGFAPTAVIVLENEGRVGLGSAHTDVDSLGASVVLGNNGVTIIANGDGIVGLNEDIVINNVCHIVKGPQFLATNRLLITSDCCRTIRVKNSGVLDLSSFTTGGTVEIAGNVKLILEPGAQVILGTVNLNFSDDAGIICDPVPAKLLSLLSPTSPTALNQYRVKFMGGPGTINFTGCASFIINDGAFVGVETSSCTLNTNITFLLNYNAAWSLGTCSDLGGAFQIGNISHQAGATIACTLLINGNNAEFTIGQGAFVGLGVAVLSKLSGTVPNTWYVEQTYDVQSIAINVNNGIFSHDIIWDGNQAVTPPYLIGSALAFGSGVTNFNIRFLRIYNNVYANLSPAAVRGGGNMYLSTTIVPATMNIQSSNSSTVGILASNTLFQGSGLAPLILAGSASTVFNQWRTQYIGGSNTQYAARADIGPFTRNQLMLGYVDGPNAAAPNFIGRQSYIQIDGTSAATVDQAHCIDIGAGLIAVAAGAPYPRRVVDLKSLV